MNWNHEMMGWGGGFGMIFVWVILIIIVIILVKSLMSKSNGGIERKETPMEILKRRYASGEIGKTEYEEKKKDIQD